MHPPRRVVAKSETDDAEESTTSLPPAELIDSSSEPPFGHRLFDLGGNTDTAGGIWTSVQKDLLPR